MQDSLFVLTKRTTLEDKNSYLYTDLGLGKLHYGAYKIETKCDIDSAYVMGLVCIVKLKHCSLLLLNFQTKELYN